MEEEGEGVTIQFEAAGGGTEESPGTEDGWFEVGVSENSDGSGRVLVFQCLLAEPDEQNTSLGMDTYCISNESGGSTYAGIDAVEANEEHLRVTFTDTAAEELELTDKEVDVSLRKLSDDTIAEIHAGLRRVLAYGRADARPSRMSIG